MGQADPTVGSCDRLTELWDAERDGVKYKMFHTLALKVLLADNDAFTNSGLKKGVKRVERRALDATRNKEYHQ